MSSVEDDGDAQLPALAPVSAATSESCAEEGGPVIRASPLAAELRGKASLPVPSASSGSFAGGGTRDGAGAGHAWGCDPASRVRPNRGSVDDGHSSRGIPGRGRGLRPGFSGLGERLLLPLPTPLAEEKRLRSWAPRAAAASARVLTTSWSWTISGGSSFAKNRAVDWLWHDQIDVAEACGATVGGAGCRPKPVFGFNGATYSAAEPSAPCAVQSSPLLAAEERSQWEVA
ncbi:hypothetical protein HPB47_011785 [Ixodes persulcatus]|uniref:Uncharacterized protein n=1 Tax=Ixodes persulcatus TaxID=34615 RepID=A0AC60NVC0_IXOPE|nr:hypothetical protein HPB47_011785 [Ixodes persulcatus]